MDHDVPWPRCAGHRLLVLALPPAGCVALRGGGGHLPSLGIHFPVCDMMLEQIGCPVTGMCASL